MASDEANPARDAARRTESRALAFSLVATAVLGVGAVVWGTLASSRVLLFDGVYTLAGIVLVGVSMAASRAAGAAPTPEYPFGRHAATPLAVALQGAALVGMTVYGAFDAVVLIVDGGSEAAGGSVLAYGVVSGALSLIVVLALRRAARVSALAKAEAVSWRASLLLSAVITAGGLVAVLLGAGDLARFAAFVDPVLVLVACAVITPMAIGLVREGMRELLEAAPPVAVRERIDTAVREGALASGVLEDHDLPEPIVRSTKLGQRLYVEVDFVVEHDEWTVDDEDAVRRAIVDRLEKLGYELWATVELTTDRSLAE